MRAIEVIRGEPGRVVDRAEPAGDQQATNGGCGVHAGRLSSSPDGEAA